LCGGGAGFHAVYSGLILGDSHPLDAPQTAGMEMPDTGFVPIEPILVPLAVENGLRNLRFRAQLEVPKPYLADVEALLPRVVDVLNGYLRAIEPTDITGATALVRLRGQM